jgi:membrane protease YdiL (CAAX protease family)
MSRKIIFVNISMAACLLALTFAVPAAQWLATKLVANPEFKGIISSVSIVLCASLWLITTKTFHFRTFSFQWKIFCYLALIAILGLLIFNMQNQPVAKITGQARSPLEVFDLIILLPVAEEFVFRGAIWSQLEKRGLGHIAVLAGTSLLFGVEHLGYWAQSSWSLLPDAYLHAISMIFAGIFFGFFRLKSDSLAVPVALHMLANGAILLTQ